MDEALTRAVRLLYSASLQQRELAQDQLDLADRMHTVISSLHDQVIAGETETGDYHARVQALRAERSAS